MSDDGGHAVVNVDGEIFVGFFPSSRGVSAVVEYFRVNDSAIVNTAKVIFVLWDEAWVGGEDYGTDQVMIGLFAAP